MMMGGPKVQAFIVAADQSLRDGSFVKLSLGNYKGQEENLKNIYIKKALIQGEEKLSFTYHYKTRDIVKNHAVAEGIGKLRDCLNDDFHIATLFTTSFDLLWENIHDKKIVLKEKPPTHAAAALPGHNKEKKRLIPAKEKIYLCALKITDAQGNVFKNAQDKYRQINRYIEILEPLIKDIPAPRLKKVVDMGSGKGYLTFALYDYLHNILKLPAEVIGVEYRADLVDLCNIIAAKSAFTALRFERGVIEKYAADDISVLIALHACDTATDEAIYKGIEAKAELIVVAPCCHKQIRREMEKNKTAGELDFLLRHGIFMERQAEMVTDGIRALILEYFGYSTKVFEFISDAHTPKNVLIVGKKRAGAPARNKDVLDKIKEAKGSFGIGRHYLERLTGI